MPALELFEAIFGDDAKIDYISWYEEIGYWDIELSKWNQFEENSKTLKFKLKVKDVPFISETPLVRKYRVEKSENSFKILVESQTIGVPYGDYFFVREEWEAVDYEEQGKSIMRMAGYVDFVASTMFKGTIEKKTKEEMIKSSKMHLDIMKLRGITYEKQKKKAGNEEVMHELEELTSYEGGMFENYSMSFVSISQDWIKNRPSVVIKVLLWILLFFFLISVNSKLNRILEKLDKLAV